MHRSVALVLTLAGALTAASTTPAQQPPAPPVAPADAEPASTQPEKTPPRAIATPRQGAVGATAGAPDPMLRPPAQPTKVLSSWQQGVRVLRTTSPGLQTARARVQQADALLERSRVGSRPTLRGTASLNRHLLLGNGVRFGSEGVQPNATIPDPATVLDARLELRQPLLALSAWRSIDAAHTAKRAAELSARDVERLQLAGVANSAVAVVTAERVAQISRVSLESALSVHELTRRRAQLGAASAFDVLRAEQEVTMTRSQVVAADERLRQARENLGLSLGDSEAWTVGKDLRAEELVATARHVCEPLKDITARDDVRAAATELERSRQAESVNRYRFFPTLDLVSTLAYTSNVNRSPNAKHVTWTVGALLVWPLFDGGDSYAAIRQSEAETTMARQRLRDAERNARVEVAQASRAMEVARANLQVSQRTREIASESSRLAKLAFVNGQGTSFDLIESSRRLREAEIDLAIREFELMRAAIMAMLARARCNV